MNPAPQPLLTSLATAACPGCGRESPVAFYRGRALTSLCPECSIRRQVEEEERRERERMAPVQASISQIPPEYRREMDPARLHPTVRAVYEAFSPEEWPEQGWGFSGKTGGGKTRAVCGMARRLALRHGVPLAFLTSSALPEIALAALSPREDAARRQLRNFSEAGILVIDDIGKASGAEGNTKERGDAALMEIVEARYAHNRLTLWTLNGDSDWLASRFGPDRGPAIVRRLRDMAWGNIHVVSGHSAD